MSNTKKIYWKFSVLVVCLCRRGGDDLPSVITAATKHKHNTTKQQNDDSVSLKRAQQQQTIKIQTA